MIFICQKQHKVTTERIYTNDAVIYYTLLAKPVDNVNLSSTKLTAWLLVNLSLDTDSSISSQSSNRNFKNTLSNTVFRQQIPTKLILLRIIRWKQHSQIPYQNEKVSK